MAYDEALAERVRKMIGGRGDLTEKKMFGGLAFMLHGHMALGIVGDELMVRVGKDGLEAAPSKPHARPMDFTGKAMKGMVYVGVDGTKNPNSLEAWVGRGVGFADTMPPK